MLSLESGLWWVLNPCLLNGTEVSSTEECPRLCHSHTYPLPRSLEARSKAALLVAKLFPSRSVGPQAPLTLPCVLGLQSHLVCREALATPLFYLLAGSHCFVESWLVRLFRVLCPLDSSRSVFTKSASTGPGQGTCEDPAPRAWARMAEPVPLACQSWTVSHSCPGRQAKQILRPHTSLVID